MLNTDAWMFLDIDQPLCAWSTYRGVLLSPPHGPNFLSIWTAGIVERGGTEILEREIALEQIRAAEFPERISRLKGLFCLPSWEAVEGALAWDTDGRSHFQPKFLAEVSLHEMLRQDKLDANWITYRSSCKDLGWMREYWSGAPMPHSQPVWELLVDGRVNVLGTDLRQRAYEAIKAEFSKSLMWLEISRLAAWLGSPVASINSYLQSCEGGFAIRYLINMEDADSPQFLERLGCLLRSGHPVNHADLKSNIESGTFGNVPDFRPYEKFISTDELATNTSKRWLVQNARLNA